MIRVAVTHNKMQKAPCGAPCVTSVLSTKNLASLCTYPRIYAHVHPMRAYMRVRANVRVCACACVRACVRALETQTRQW